MDQPSADGALFLGVALEIKEEILFGSLRRWREAALPVAMAIGDIVAPSLLFLATAGTEATRGWAIPMATDVAFALGVIALFGRPCRTPRDSCCSPSPSGKGR